MKHINTVIPAAPTYRKDGVVGKIRDRPRTAHQPLPHLPSQLVNIHISVVLHDRLFSGTPVNAPNIYPPGLYHRVFPFQMYHSIKTTIGTVVLVHTSTTRREGSGFSG